MKGSLVRHLSIWLVGGALLRLAVVAPEACPETAPEQIHAAAIAAGEWIQRNQDPTGQFLYGYNLETNLVNSDYNIVRHAGTTNSLYQLVVAGESQFLAAADLGLEYLLERQIDHEDWASVADPTDRAKLGTTGFVVVALAQRRQLTGDHVHDELMRALGRFIIAQQEPDGSIRAYWNQQTRTSSPGEYGPFATGEAAWALVELDNTFPDEGWWDAADKTLHYMADGSREHKEGHLARLPDHWAAYALEAAGPDRLDDDLADYGRRLAGYFSMRLRMEDQLAGSPGNVLVRRFPGPPAGVGTAGEGMAALYRLAQTDDRLTDLSADMKERMVCTAGTLVQRQVTETEAADEPDPGLANGAWFDRSYTQVDDQQHVLSALLGASQSMWEANE